MALIGGLDFRRRRRCRAGLPGAAAAGRLGARWNVRRGRGGAERLSTGDGPRPSGGSSAVRDRRSPLKFCMVTTFFGAHSFGGDAAYVDRLVAGAAAAAGMRSTSSTACDAFDAVRGRHPLRPYEPAARPARPPAGQPVRAPLAARHPDHRPARLQGRGARREARRGRHRRRPLPQHLACRRAGRPGDGAARRPDHDGARALADLPDAPALEVRPQAVRLARLRPLLARGAAAPAGLAVHRGHRARLGELDALIFPSRHALDEHRSRGIGAPMVHLPYFLPDGWSGGDRGRAAAGRRRGRTWPRPAGSSR